MSNQLMTGAEIVVKALQDQGVRHIFGYPGGAVLPIYDALFQQDSVEHILVRHEQGAAHAAEGYARSTGKAGVLLVTSGPGATNAVTGLADAMMDSIPLVCITGQVPTHLIGSDAFSRRLCRDRQVRQVQRLRHPPQDQPLQNHPLQRRRRRQCVHQRLQRHPRTWQPPFACNWGYRPQSGPFQNRSSPRHPALAPGHG